jgi:hypothetical protein
VQLIFAVETDTSACGRVRSLRGQPYPGAPLKSRCQALPTQSEHARARNSERMQLPTSDDLDVYIRH